MNNRLLFSTKIQRANELRQQAMQKRMKSNYLLLSKQNKLEKIIYSMIQTI